VAVGAGMHAAPWRDTRPGAHVARAAKFYLWGRTDAGHCCPVSMTYAIVPALRNAPDLARRYEPLLTSAVYDPGLRPAGGKRGLIAGMSMTEKQGGSDVRANTTRAVPVPGDGEAGGGSYLLTGHKWFTSAPMSDVFLVLAQAPGACAPPSGTPSSSARCSCTPSTWRASAAARPASASRTPPPATSPGSRTSCMRSAGWPGSLPPASGSSRCRTCLTWERSCWTRT